MERGYVWLILASIFAGLSIYFYQLQQAEHAQHHSSFQPIASNLVSSTPTTPVVVTEPPPPPPPPLVKFELIRITNDNFVAVVPNKHDWYDTTIPVLSLQSIDVSITSRKTGSYPDVTPFRFVVKLSNNSTIYFPEPMKAYEVRLTKWGEKEENERTPGDFYETVQIKILDDNIPSGLFHFYLVDNANWAGRFTSGQFDSLRDIALSRQRQFINSMPVE